MKISIIIPAYNESNSIGDTIKELLDNFRSLHEIKDFEIIVVDDHSSDNTFDVVSRMNNSKIKCLRLSRRSGSHIAIRVGVANSAGDAALCISADGQESPAYIKEMLSKWSKGADVVWALRKNRKDEPWYIRIPAQIFYWIIYWLTAGEYKNIDLSRADFFLLDRKVIDAIDRCNERNTSLLGLIAWVGFSQDFVEYARRPRRFGLSKWEFNRKVRLAKDWIVAFSGLPLKLITVLGIFLAILGFLFGAYLIANVIFGNPVTGWTSLMMAILVIGGTQMIMLGIAGEYIWRNLDESRRRPLYFVEKKTEINKA